MYRNNLQGFDEIGQVMAQVHNDLGLTGDAADAASEKFLKFGTATGQDAAGAVSHLREVLDAWNLKASDAGTLMDKLVVSHQKFGGEIGANTDALRAMAPAMQAANMTVDDGIGLLNLFETAGIDASKAPAALAHAVKQLKPGQDLNDLIAQIASIQDPTLRAQKAMEIFGAKAGIGFAQAIKPGTDSLESFGITATDAAGATDRAAAAVESGFGSQFQLILKNAGGALADFGTHFGPLLQVAAAFGPQLTKALGAGLGAIGGVIAPRLAKAFGELALDTTEAAAAGTAHGVAMGSAAAAAEIATETSIGVPGKVAEDILPLAISAATGTGAAAGTAAATAEIATEGAGVAAGQATVAAEAAPAAGAAGTLIGSAMGIAAGVAFAAAGGVAIALAFKAIVLDPGLQQQSRDIGTSVGKEIQTGANDQLLESKAALEKGIADIKALPWAGSCTGTRSATSRASSTVSGRSSSGARARRGRRSPRASPMASPRPCPSGAASSRTS
jgi:hypothetical protein